eukprot:12659716-Alexandrium_andersonii.AAC.1
MQGSGNCAERAPHEQPRGLEFRTRKPSQDEPTQANISDPSSLSNIPLAAPRRRWRRVAALSSHQGSSALRAIFRVPRYRCRSSVPLKS